jgi:site-specific recombinase XerD
MKSTSPHRSRLVATATRTAPEPADERKTSLAGTVSDKPVPFFSSVELSKLEEACQGSGFAQRRDAAILAVFRSTGIRLTEMAGIRHHPDDLDHGDVDLHRREIYVRGKGGKDRIVRIDRETARRIDRYLRARAKHPRAYHAPLWLAGDRGPLTRDGIYQMIKRRGAQAGVRVYPHRFRHHFSHTSLERGGPEGDLMELNGWSSPQMLARYGASARSARARRTHDRVMADNALRSQAGAALAGCC